MRQETYGHSLQGSVCAVSAFKTLQDDFNQTQPWEIAVTFLYINNHSVFVISCLVFNL